jgi:TrmH family RNA methyltransferase
MKVITSKENKTFKFVKGLLDKKNRENFFIIEGIKNVEEASKAGASFEMLCFSEDRYEQLAESLRISALKIGQTVLFDSSLFSKISDTQTPQGVLAVLDKKEIKPIEKIEPKDVFVVLENLQDPGNMGTIIRSCAAAGVKGLVTCGDCVDLFSPKTVRSSMGGIFHIQYKHFPGSDKAIAFFKENKILTYALALTEDNTIYDIHRWEGVALFIGNESNGLQKSTVEKCNRSVFIPMPGYSESLNAAVAASLAIYETVRYRLGKGR